jgi:hypothetical protein
MELVKVVLTVEIEASFVASQTNKLICNAANNTLQKTTGSFFDDGFSVGGNFDYTDVDLASLLFTGQVETISDDGKLIVFSVISGTAPTVESEDDRIDLRFDLSPKNAVQYSFGLVENNGNTNYNNLVTDSEQTYYLNLVSGAFQEMTSKGSNKDWTSGTTEVKTNITGNNYKASYSIESTFVVPFFRDGQLADIENGVLPDYLDGDNSLKHVFRLEVASSVTDPNSAITIESNTNLGSSGGYGENFNGFENNYTIQSVSYEDENTNPVDGLQISATTKVTVVIECNNRNFESFDRFGIYLAYLSSSSEYTNTPTSFTDNFLYDIFTEEVAPATYTGSTIIKSITPSVSTNTMTLQFEVSYSVAQQLKLDENSNYLLAISNENPNLTAGNSDRVVNIADINTYQAQAVEGFVNIDSFKFLSHPDIVGVNSGEDTFLGWNEDGLLADVTFGVDTTKEVVINGLSVLLVAHNETTGNRFELDSYDFDLSSQTLVGSTQVFNISDSRGYILKSDDQFNDVKLTTGSVVGDYQQYTIIIGQKISWQDWIRNNDADTVFYDDTKPNDNLNFLSSNYSDLNGYKIKMALALNVTGLNDIGKEVTGVEVDYSGELAIQEYNTAIGYDLQSLEFLNGEGNDIGQNVSADEDIILKSTFFADSPIVDLTDIYVIHRIETSNSANTIEEMSSNNEPPSNQILQPLTGETKLKTYLDSGNVVSECIVKASALNASSNYNVTATIQQCIVPVVSVLTVHVLGGVSYTMTTGQGSWYDQYSLPLGALTFTQSNEDEIQLVSNATTLIQQNSCTIDELIVLDILNLLSGFSWEIKDNPIHDTETKLVTMANQIEVAHTGVETGQSLITGRYIVDDANVTAINSLDAKIQSDILQLEIIT